MAKSAKAFHYPDRIEKHDSKQSIKKENRFPSNFEEGVYFFGRRLLVRPANQLQLRQKAYELIYNLYCEMGIIKRKDYGLWISIFDALPETTTFVAADVQGRIEGALTVVCDSQIGLPADELYKEEIDKLRNDGERICEFISLGVNSAAKKPLRILAGLFYCAFLHAWQVRQSSDLAITVHSRYEDFYCKKIFFEKIGPERSYAKVNGEPTVLLNLSLQRINKLRYTHRIFPFFMLNCSDQEEFEIVNNMGKKCNPLSDEEFYKFFIQKSDVWEEATPMQREYIKKLYPAHKIDHFKVSRALANGVSKKITGCDEVQSNESKLSQI